MNLSKKTLVAAFAIASVTGASMFAQNALAYGDAAATDTLASQLANKFKLDQNEVKAALQEFHDAKRAEFETAFNERLDQAVADDDLTEAQKDLILDKRDEIKSKIDAAKKLEDQTERRDTLKQIRSDVKTWAKDNNINLRWLGGTGMTQSPNHHEDITER